jgi:hypothetical protein
LYSGDLFEMLSPFQADLRNLVISMFDQFGGMHGNRRKKLYVTAFTNQPKL